VAGAAVLAGLTGWALLKPADEGIRASVALTDVDGGPARTVSATVKLDPPDAADDAEWLTITSWQGGGLVVDRLTRTGPGEYRTNEPIPVHGTWKSMIRLHRGSALMGAPVYLPEDKAIPVEGVPAEAAFTRSFQTDHELLQREQQSAAPGLWAIAYAAVIGIALGFLALLAWGVHRLAAVRAEPGNRPPERPRRPAVRREPQPSG
jgi:hypothetical protein